MNSRNKVLNIFNRSNSNEGAFWTGHPNDLTLPIYSKKWQIEPEREAIFNYLDDDCRWFTADEGYCHPESLPAFDPSYKIDRRKSLSAEGCFANVETVAEIEAYPWPDTSYCDFSKVYEKINKHQDKMIFTGMWSPFFHILADFFGMENYFIKMYENPSVVEAATERIVNYYVAANEKFFAGLGNKADTMFFGNDFGTQLNLFISPENFKKFILPSFKRLIAVGKKFNKKIMLHSCGSIYRIISELINAGIDVLHPIQAQAEGMSAKDLVQYKNDLAFVGGIDAQTFIVNANPNQVMDEVKRVRDVLGPNIVISPSHEEILPNVPAENMLTMSKVARSAV